MKAKEKTRRSAKSGERETKRLFPEMKLSDMTAIDRKITDLLIAEGYRVTGTQRIERSGSYNDLNVNRMELLRGERERVFLTTHEPIPGAGE
jgi:hypothetical protein